MTRFAVSALDMEATASSQLQDTHLRDADDSIIDHLRDADDSIKIATSLHLEERAGERITRIVCRFR